MIGRHSWWWIPAFLFFVCSSALGFMFGIELAEDWNTVAAEREAIQKACIEGNDRACRVYEVRYGR
ncbi:hypothetical protein [Stenotrophomonas sp. HMWF003]|uniref:hypothetical protein n=1 Tax=Stenotrophomonas sp. HMWF003 TaxID=2056840 RepID=UPI000D479884|nr:hypothetical protein [Stenotrophomonas sp. HMWF003]PTT59848.1 hypothetical protein DBR34_13885 [Stenotrophomonas sp. HMWF003]